MISGLFAAVVWILLIYFILVRDIYGEDGGIVRYRFYRAVWIFLVPAPMIVWLNTVAGDWPAWHPAYAVVYAFAVLIFLPDLVYRTLVRPMGWVRGAYVVSLLANRTWNLAPHTGAICAALLVRLRRRRSQDRPVDDGWLHRRRPPRKGPLVAPHVLAESLRAQLRGDKDLARFLMETIVYMPPASRGPREAQLAEQWLLLHAAERGAWHEIAQLAPTTWSSRRLQLFLVIAGARLDADAPRWKLAWHWLTCGRSWATRHLARRAWFGSPPAADHSETDRTQTSDTVEQALALTATATSTEAAGAAWQRALSGGGLGAWLERRCERLELDVDDARARLEDSVGEAMADLAAETGTPVPSITGADFPAAHLEQALHRLEASLQLLAERQVASEPGGDPHAYLDLWCNFRLALHGALLQGGSRASLYHQMLGPVWEWVDHLYDERHQRPLAQAIFAWLYQWTAELGDEDAAKVLLHNARLAV